MQLPGLGRALQAPGRGLLRAGRGVRPRPVRHAGLARQARDEEYGALAREITADNQTAEPGQQIFEWFVVGDDVYIYERHDDSAAVSLHVQRFVENFAVRFVSLCTPTRMSVYGEPSEDLKVAITRLNPRYLWPLAGHARS